MAILGMIALSLCMPTAAAEELRVVATFSIIGDFARNVGGERIMLTTLVGPDGDAHVYAPKPADAAAVAAAQLVLVNGLQFEGFLQRLVRASGTRAAVVELTTGIEALRDTDDGHHHHGDDEHHHADEIRHGNPHAWQSIPNALIYVGNIEHAFCTADPGGCDAYRRNADDYRGSLELLDREIHSTLATIPPSRRTIISSHDAFGYFAHEYGLRLLAPQNSSMGAEASAADVAALVRQIRNHKASAIFVENIGDPRLSAQIARETGLRVGGTLYSDSLSGRDGPAATYIAMMRHNAATIRHAILGDQP